MTDIYTLCEETVRITKQVSKVMSEKYVNSCVPHHKRKDCSGNIVNETWVKYLSCGSNPDLFFLKISGPVSCLLFGRSFNHDIINVLKVYKVYNQTGQRFHEMWEDANNRENFIAFYNQHK